MHLPTLLTTLLLSSSTLAANLSTIYQFPNGTWLENIASTRNGSLLVSLIGAPEVHIVHPHTAPTSSSLIATFPSANAVLGITELKPDVFAVAVGTIILPSSTVPGSYSIWTIDLSCQNVTTTKIADLKTLQMVNGIALLNPHTLLLADSYGGAIAKLDLRTKEHSVVLRDPILEANSSAPTLTLGVNGIRMHANYLYYSSTVHNTLGRVKLNLRTGAAVGAFTNIASGEQISLPDDFVVLADGSVLQARPIADTLQHVGLRGEVELLGVVGGPTSVVLARGEKMGSVAYVCTSGLVGGVAREGGRVVRVEF